MSGTIDPDLLASMTPEGRDLVRRVFASTDLHITITTTATTPAPTANGA